MYYIVAKEVLMTVSWFSRADKESYATIYNTNISINKAGSNQIQSAYAALLGIDEDNKLIILKPISKDKAEDGTLDKDMIFTLSGGDSYTRVSSTDFVNEVAKITKCDYSEGKKKYLCHFDSKEKVLIIDLKKEIN